MIRAAATLLAPGRLRRPGAREALERYRDARVRRLVAHAYERVPYYRRLLDARLRPRVQVASVGALLLVRLKAAIADERSVLPGQSLLLKTPGWRSRSL